MHAGEDLVPESPLQAEEGTSGASRAPTQRSHGGRQCRSTVPTRRRQTTRGKSALLLLIHGLPITRAGSLAEWLACWTQAQKGPGSNRSRNAVG